MAQEVEEYIGDAFIAVLYLMVVGKVFLIRKAAVASGRAIPRSRTVVWVLIAITCFVRCVYFAVPDSAYGGTYKQNNEMLTKPLTALQYVLKLLGHWLFVCCYVVIVVFWISIYNGTALVNANGTIRTETPLFRKAITAILFTLFALLLNFACYWLFRPLVGLMIECCLMLIVSSCTVLLFTVIGVKLWMRLAPSDWFTNIPLLSGHTSNSNGQNFSTSLPATNENTRQIVQLILSRSSRQRAVIARVAAACAGAFCVKIATNIYLIERVARECLSCPDTNSPQPNHWVIFVVMQYGAEAVCCFAVATTLDKQIDQDCQKGNDRSSQTQPTGTRSWHTDTGANLASMDTLGDMPQLYSR